MVRPWPAPGLLILLVGGCAGDAGPTWADGVADVVHRSCAPCHRPGEVAPFPLVGYDDVQKRRDLVAEMVGTRQMPPWLPTHGAFVGDRRLTADEIELLQQWVAAGAPRGDATREPKPPDFATGWQLGEPDLVVTIDAPLVVEPSGDDVFRNLVLPVPLDGLRFVAAVEIRPGNRAVHHAVLGVDASRQARRLDALDATPGFPGMAMGGAKPPDGQFLGWTPGKRVLPQPLGMAFRLWPGQDFVLQLHVQPTGRRETIQPQIGLYFTDEAPNVTALPLVLWSDRIDIAAGDADFRIRDELQLPVPVVVHAIYPHAHQLGRTLRGTALLPNGTEQRLLEIARWDFDWQDDYRLREPLRLPAGTRLLMEYSYDNSAANPNNPNRPPQRVGFGQRSRDEMGTMTFSLTVADAAAERWLQRAVLQHDLGKAPEAGNLWLELAGLERERGELAAAFAALQEAERWHPDRGAVLAELGLCHERAGRLDEAERQYRLAVEQDPMQGHAHAQLGALLGRRGASRAAREHFRIALLTMPNVAALHANLATASVGEGDPATAERHFAQALRLDPEHFAANFLFGRLLLERGDKAAALPLLRTAARLRPADPAVQQALAAAAR